MSADEIWTPENEADFQRVTSDYLALRSQKERVEQRNEAALTAVAAEILASYDESSEIDTIRDSDAMVQALRVNATEVRAALKPYDKTGAA